MTRSIPICAGAAVDTLEPDDARASLSSVKNFQLMLEREDGMCFWIVRHVTWTFVGTRRTNGCDAIQPSEH